MRIQRSFRLTRRVKSSVFCLILFHVFLLMGSPSVKKGLFAVWWLFIWVLDSLIHLRSGSSLLTRHRKEFYMLLPSSILIWLIFELYNTVLHNWEYQFVQEFILFRWLGYTLAFATVLPALFETFQLLDVYGLFKNSQTRPIPESTRWYVPFVVVGIVALTIPLIWPKIFFPLIWIGFIFLLEPINHRMGGVSLMRQWEGGSLRTLYLLLTTGVIIGLLWEFWNHWAITKWAYTFDPIAFPWKIFEMPIEGYIGFPPFVVTCYVMVNTLYLFRGAGHWQRPMPAAKPKRYGRTMLAGFLMIMFFFTCFYLIDQNSVASTRPFELRINFLKSKTE